LSAHTHLAADQLPLSGEHLDELLLPVARDARDANDLARQHLEPLNLDGLGPGAVLGTHFAELENHIGSLLARDAWARWRQRAFADHHGGEIPASQSLGIAASGDFATPQHGDAIGVAHDLTQLVGDE